MNRKGLILKGKQLWSCLTMICLAICGTTQAQDCDNVLGVVNFKPNTAHAADSLYTLDALAITYPSGSMCDGVSSQIDSFPDFTDGKHVMGICVGNPAYLNYEDHEEFKDIDVPMYVVTCAGEPMSKLFEYSVYCAKPGTAYKVKFKLWNIMSLDGEVGGTWPSYAGYAPYDLVVGVPQPYGQGMEATKLTPQDESKEFEFEGVVGDNESSITFGIWTGYNCVKNCVLGISNIEITGCLNPRIKSGQGLKVCEGEQTPLTLDREYNAKSYKWEKSTNGGGSWTTISTSKTALEEITENASYRCTVDGQVSNVLEIEKEVCCVVNGKPASRKTVFHEDFGYFKTSRTYVDKDGVESTLPAKNVDFRVDTRFSIPETTFDAEGQINDGSYAVVVPTENGYALQGNGQYATWMNGVTTDHSSTIDGRDNSACMFINVTENYKGKIFEDRIDGICKNKELYFECYIANMSGADMSPLVTIKILKTDGTEIPGAVLENVEAVKGGGWIPCKLSGIMTEETSVILQVIADCGTNCSNGSFWSKGNDLALDDIKFMTCSPPSISAYLDMETLSLDTTVCEDVNLNIQMPVSKLLDDYFGGNQMYVLQASENGKTWKHVTTSSKPSIDFNSDDLTALYPDAEVIYARVIVASPSAALEFEADPNMADADSDCNDYSISDAFTITIDCPTCTKSAKPKISADREAKKKTIGLCKGEEVTLSGNDLTGMDAKGNEYTNFNWYWFLGSSKKDSDNGVTPKDITVSWDDADGKGGELQVILKSEDAAYETVSECMQYDTITIVANKMPTDTIDNPKPFCEGKPSEMALEIAGTKIKWFEDADTTSSLGSTSSAIKTLIEENKGDNTKPYEYWYVATDTETGCEGEVHKLTVDIREVPEAPDDEEVQMVVTGKDEPLEHEDLVSTAEKTLIWYYKDCDGCELAPKIDCSKEGNYTFKIAYKSGDCIGDEGEVTVVVTAAPKPEFEKIDLCEGDDLDVASRVKLKDDTKYELNWYTDETKTTKATAPNLTNAAPGAYTYYVTQQGIEEPKPESDMLVFTINVYGVKPPTADNIDYCSGETAETFKATAVKDAANFYDADGFIWSLSGTDLAANYAPSTSAASTTTTTYSVRQTYTTPISKKVCEGANTDFDVKVTKVEALAGTFNVSYVHADGETNKKFSKDILTQDPTVVTLPTDANSKVVWSVDNSTFSNTVPTPLYKDLTSPGEVQEQKFYAQHVVQITNDKTCKAESQEITVLITSTPVPNVTPMTYCEDHTFAADAASKLVSPNNNGGTFDITGFDIYWFTDKDKANACASSGTVTGNIGGAPNLGSLSIDFGTESKYVQEFYVVQGNLSVTPPQISAANILQITFFKKPEIIVANVPAVCNKTIDLTSPNVWHAAADVNVTAEYRDEAGAIIGAEASAIKESGTYSINAYIMAGEDQCHADPENVTLDIQNLKIDVVAPATTCPGSNAQLTLTTTYTYNDDPSLPAHTASYTYKDNGGSDKTGSVNITSTTTITTDNLVGEAGKSFNMDLTVEAGACTATWSDIITLGDGPVSGQIVFTETSNALAKSGYPINAVDKRKGENVFYSCGESVKIDLTDLTKTETLVEWFDDENCTTPSAGMSGEIATASVASGEKTYYVRYTNDCFAYIVIKIVAEPVTVRLADASADPAVALCEGEAFERAVKVECVGSNINKVWYKDNAKQNNITDEINFKRLDKTQHEGFYAFKATNKGCSDSIDVVDLKVKQYIKFEPKDFEIFNKERAYIVGADESIDIPLDFTVPSDMSGVSVDWQDATSGTAGSGTTDKYTIASVDADHKIHIMASGADYCEATDDVVVLRDAKIRIDVSIDAAMCLRDNKKLIVDTTGTGRGVRGPITVDIIAIPTTGTTAQIKGMITGTDGLMTKEVSPTSDTKYKATIKYGDKTEEAEADIKVYSYIVKANAAKVCADMPVELKATVTPSTAHLTWYDSNKTTEVGTGESVTVTPPFEAFGDATQYKRRYYINATSSDVDCESMFSVDVTVYKPLEGALHDTTICEGNDVRLDAGSYNAARYEWSSSIDPTTTNGRFKNVKPDKDAVYTVNMSRGECKATDRSVVTVKPRPMVSSFDSLSYRKIEVIIDETHGTAPFFLSVDGSSYVSNSNVIDSLSYTYHTLTIKDFYGCQTDTFFTVNAPPVVIPSMFSPNGDGENDKWLPNSITESYPDAEFVIYDRWGKVIARFKGEDGGWDGTYNGVAMPATDYWYEVHIREIDTTYTGHFTLLRR